jgi:hypothetical protein
MGQSVEEQHMVVQKKLYTVEEFEDYIARPKTATAALNLSMGRL